MYAYFCYANQHNFIRVHSSTGWSTWKVIKLFGNICRDLFQTRRVHLLFLNLPFQFSYIPILYLYINDCFSADAFVPLNESIVDCSLPSVKGRRFVCSVNKLCDWTADPTKEFFLSRENSSKIGTFHGWLLRVILRSF